MKTLNISDETYELIKDQLTASEVVDISSLDELVGKKIFIRTVTYHLVGEVTKVLGNLVFLKNASWIADSGRFSDFIKKGVASEVEPVGDWFVNWQSVVDGGFFKHKLPTEQK